MAAWSTRTRAAMPSLLPFPCVRSVRAAISSRLSRWADALVERLVCCRGRFDEDEIDERQARHDKGSLKRDGSVITEPESEPEPAAREVEECEEDFDLTSTLINSQTMDERESCAIGIDIITDAPSSHGAVERSTPSLSPITAATANMDGDRAVVVLERFMRRCIAHRNTRAREIHGAEPFPPNRSSAEGASHSADSDQDQAAGQRERFASRLRTPQIPPPSFTVSPHNSSSVSSRSRMAMSPVGSIDCAFHDSSPSSPSSSIASSNASRCSSTASWRDTNSHLLAENTTLRRHLEATPPRVYDFETDPRFMNEQQMRRRAILRHRDALRAQWQEFQTDRPQWR